MHTLSQANHLHTTKFKIQSSARKAIPRDKSYIPGSPQLDFYMVLAPQ